MQKKSESYLDNLLDDNSIIHFLRQGSTLLGNPVFITYPDGKLPFSIELIIKDSYPMADNEKEAINELLIKTDFTINEHVIVQSPVSGTAYFFKPLTIYSIPIGFYCVAYIHSSVNTDAALAFFHILSDILRANYELIDLIKDNITHYKQLSLFSLVTDWAVSSIDLHETFKKTLETAIERTGAERGLAFELNEEDEILELLYVIPQLKGSNVGFALFMDSNIFADSLRKKKSVIYNEVYETTGFIHPLPFLSPKNYLITPLSYKENLIGVIAVCDKKDNKDFSSIDQKILEAIAGQASITIENQKLFLQLKQNFIKTIEALSAAIDMKDTYTIGHSKRVSDISIAIAQELDITDSKLLEDIKIGALLHDIGKIGIPSDILFKTTEPTAPEWEIIKKHPQNGYEIAKGLSGFEGILPTIMHHHERWDGNGYPSRLKGKDIPLATRIVSVADAYDTIISRRPYKEPYTSEEAYKAINKAAGAQFDPVIVSAFVRAYQKGKIKKRSEE